MDFKDRKQTARELTSYIVHKHYCENDSEAIVALFGEPFSWFGAGEHEYAVGRKKVAGIVRQFKGMVPKCNISDEEYEVLELTPDIFVCSGRMWITTDPSTNIYLRVHQRITAVFVWKGDDARCCHLHLSNPYTEMTDSDVGFPTGMARQSYEYLQECIAEQRKQIQLQTTMLERLSFEDSLTGLFNRNKFNQRLDHKDDSALTCLGVACFDLNELKAVNDRLGHSAGDDLIRRTAGHIKAAFSHMAYRIGGDEFVVIDENADEAVFRSSIDSIRHHMKKNQINVSIGISWRSSGCSLKEQFDEADYLMYQEKARFYADHNRDRRRKLI